MTRDELKKEMRMAVIRFPLTDGDMEAMLQVVLDSIESGEVVRIQETYDPATGLRDAYIILKPEFKKK